MRRTLFRSLGSTCSVEPSWRLRFELFLVRMWLRWDWARLKPPLPVRRKRLAAPRFVFSFPIVTPSGLFACTPRRGGRCRRVLAAARSRASRRYSLFLRRHHHDHLPPFHLRHLLDYADFVQVFPDPCQEPGADFLVRHLPAPEPERDLRLVAALEEFHELPQLDPVIALVRARAKLDFLDVYLLLLAARRLRLLVQLEQVLAEIHHPANRRVGRGRDLDEVEIRVPCDLKRLFPGHDSELFPVGADHTHPRCFNLLVAPDALRGCDTKTLLT